MAATPPTTPTLRDHVVTAILDAAATVLAEHGSSASMADVASAAGVGRTTLYRYFPNRDLLVDALTRAALSELADKLASARLEAVPFVEGMARLTRAVFSTASKYSALTQVAAKSQPPSELVARIEVHVTGVFRRGRKEGALRTDLSLDTLQTVFMGLLHGAVEQGLHLQLGVEQAAAALTSFALGGAGKRPSK